MQDLLSRLEVVKEKLVPFWGDGMVTMEFAPSGAAFVSGHYAFRPELFHSPPGDKEFVHRFVFYPDNPTLMENIADDFRNWMCSFPPDVMLPKYKEHLAA